MKKIVIFYKSYQKYGGQEKVIWNFSHYLAEKGYFVDIYSMKIKDVPKDKNITVKKVFIPNLGRGFRTLAFALYAYKKAKRYKDACIFGFGKTFYQDIYRSGGGVHKYYFQRAMLKYSNPVQAKIYKLKKYMSMSHWINLFIEKLTFENNNLRSIIVPSEFVKKQILNNFRVDASKITIIRNGIDPKRFYPDKRLREEFRKKLNIDEYETVFSFVSTNHRLKGLEFLLKASKIVKSKGYKFRLIIAGGGDDKYFHKMIDRLELSEVVLYLGRVLEIEKVYNGSDIFLYPTLFDASANVILEAMACKNVPVASIYSGTNEIISENKNGLLITNPTNIKEIASKMETLLKNKQLISQLQKEALETVTSYTTSDMFPKMENIIRSILNKKTN